MAGIDFFSQRPAISPTIYVYELIGVASHTGYIKVGYTERDVETRIKEQLGASHIPYKLLLVESAMCPDGSCFMDHDVHSILERKGFTKLDIADDNEWYNCKVSDVQAAINELKSGIRLDGKRTQVFKMRPEQERAVEMTKEYFKRAKSEDPNRIPKFLWNAKMRFGKTFAAYELAKKMGFTRVLVLTFKPAVESAWEEDLVSHTDFEGWQFVSDKEAKKGAKSYDSKRLDTLYNACDKAKPIVVFASLQNVLGTNENGGIKAMNTFIHAENWDLVIFDEYHFGAWRENAKKLFDDPDEEADLDFDVEKYQLEEAANAYNETFLPITTKHFLFLSGTPFRAITSGEFIEDQIFNWTYADEQRAKENWVGPGNPYASLPRMVMLTYRIPDSIRQIAMQGEFDEFDLNVFFSAKPVEKNKIETSRFVYENEVQKWLDLIRGSYLPSNIDDLKLGQDKRPPMPFSDTRLLNVLSHTIWLLPNVASCYAMYNLLMGKNNTFFHDPEGGYRINVCAGPKAGIGLDALEPVQKSMGDPLTTKTITLSCGKLTTGVTVRPWTGIFMLRNLKSPETYFQAAFRVQSPWVIKGENGAAEIMKNECYVFDFALDRALRQISDYSCRLDANEANPEKKVAEFINFLPVLAFDGSTMKQVSAQDILDISLSGTSATLLARRWQSALLVNVDNDTLKRLMESEEAMRALENIEAFRPLKQDIQIIINKSEAVRKKKERGEKLTSKEQKELTEAEKDLKNKRKKIQEKLIKFATRIPIFMYLTDYRERSLKDVIAQLEPGLFKKVTGLAVKDFDLLCHLGIFNANLMNDAIFKFKRYEDSSLSYTGIDKNADQDLGGWDTVIKRAEYQRLFYNQQATAKSDGKDAAAKTEPIVGQKGVSDTPIVRKARSVSSQFEPKPISVANAQKRKSEETFAMPKLEEGTAVLHKVFGEGTVSKVFVNEKKINVTFAAGTKTFIIDEKSDMNAFKKNFLKIKG